MSHDNSKLTSIHKTGLGAPIFLRYLPGIPGIHICARFLSGFWNIKTHLWPVLVCNSEPTGLIIFFSQFDIL